MDLLIDIGNTTTRFCYYNNGEFETFALSSKKDERSDFFVSRIKAIADEKYINGKIDRSIISSVVPEITNEVKKAVQILYNKEPLIVSKKLKSGLNIKIDNPNELGSDLACDCVGAKEVYGFPSIVVDVGTATKILAVDNLGNYIGGSIAPGLESSSVALTYFTSLLPSTSLTIPPSPIGKNTVDSMNSGIVIGHAEMIKGLINQFLKNDCMKDTKKIILTGGNSEILLPLFDKNIVYDKNLIFKGLLTILNKNN